MFFISEPWVLLVVTALHFTGLFATIAARWSSHGPGLFGRNAFYACLTGVGAFALLSLLGGSEFWMPSCATFALMVLGATFDTSGMAAAA